MRRIPLVLEYERLKHAGVIFNVLMPVWRRWLQLLSPRSCRGTKPAELFGPEPGLMDQPHPRPHDRRPRPLRSANGTQVTANTNNRVTRRAGTVTFPWRPLVSLSLRAALASCLPINK